MTRRLPRSARAGIAGLLLPALVLVGCGDDKSGDKAGKGAASASSTSSASGDASASEGSTSGPAVGGTLTKDNFLTTVVAAQQTAGSFRGVSKSTTAGVTITMDIEATHADSGYRTHVKSAAGSPQPVEVITVDGVLYIKGQGLNLPSDKWVKLDPKSADAKGNPLGQLGDLGDPEKALAILGTPKSVTLVGEEKVDGVSATHYKLVADTAGYADKLGLPAQVTSMLPKELPLDVWLDQDNRAVKTAITFQAAGLTVSSEQTYTDYGADIRIETPPAAQTVDFADVK